jgi:hypothetical protein
LSGPANAALAALATYGFLDRAGKGETRVTERARDILHADSQGDRIQGLLDAAMEPALFRELRERFVGISVPPEDGVVTYLNRQGFNPNAVRPAAKAFLETMRYLEELGATDGHGVTPTGGPDSGDNSMPEAEMTLENNAAKPSPLTPIPTPRPGVLQEVFNLEEGPVTLMFPASMSEDSFQDLSDRIDIVLRILKRRAIGQRVTRDASAGIEQALAQPNSAQMPFMITNAQKQKLREMGHDDGVISNMTPEQAREALAGRPRHAK